VRAPLILITAHDDDMHQRTAREVGAAAYLTKPVAGAVLVNAVVSAMSVFGPSRLRPSRDTD
jgi:DNA-binding response OmpR family regulator